VRGSCQSLPNSAGTSTDAEAGAEAEEEAEEEAEANEDEEDADGGGDEDVKDGGASARAVPLPRTVLARRIAPVSMDMMIRLLMAGVLRGVDRSPQ
jgi:hypothetical protein